MGIIELKIDVGRASTITVQNGKLDCWLADRRTWWPICVLPKGEWVVVERNKNIVRLVKPISNK